MPNADPESHAGRTGASVIIPTFNRVAMLKQCLDAVSRQTLAPLEVIVVNDGSSDGTREAVLSASPPVRLIEQQNKGKSAALNAALEIARGDTVWIIDDDDIVLPDTLETLAGLLERFPEAGFAYGRHDRFAEQADGSCKRLGTGYWRDCTPDTFLQATLEDFFVHQPGMLVRRREFDRAGPFDLTLSRSQDYDMMLRLARQARPAITDKVVFLQRQHSGRRGPAGERFESSEAGAKWIEFDQLIFRHIRETWPLGLFLPQRRIETEGDRRNTLIGRGVVMARRKLWHEAIGDFEAAAAIAATPLAPDDKATLRRTFLGKYGCDEVIGQPEVRGGVRAFAARPGNGTLARSMARGLAWRIREAIWAGQPARALRLARLGLDLVR